MNSFNLVTKAVKSAFQSVGLDVVRKKNSPKMTLLGLRKLPFRTIIDVGANTGQFAKNISVYFPNAKIYCFEPLPEPFNMLSAWAKSTKGRVESFNVAIGDTEGEAEMFLHEDHTSSSSLLATTELTEQYYPFTKEQRRICVKQTMLDTALKDMQDELSMEMLIKLDVQGYEDRVVAGGSETFIKASACILEVCLDTLYEGQAGFKELLLIFDELGYQYAGNLEQVYGEDGHCIFIDAVFLNKNKCRS